MILLTKRFSKLLKLSVVIIVFCLLFILFSGYTISQDVSINEYKSYLNEYIENYTSGRKNVLDEENNLTSQNDITSYVHPQKKKKLQEFYSKVFEYLDLYSPKSSSRKTYDDLCKLTADVDTGISNSHNWSILTNKELSHCLKLSDDEKAMLKKNHEDFVKSLSSLVLPKNLYVGNGIVTVGGGKFSLLSFLIIKTLRNLGTTLPVEVLIPPKDEGEIEFCNLLLEYNAKCIYLSDVIPKESLKTFELTGYQFKSLAIIVSSFENLLLLDADNFPIKPLDNIFEEEPYKSKGMVLWPDFWRRTTSPSYYDIANIQISYNKRVRNHIDDITPPQVYTSDLNDLTKIPLHDLEGTIPDASTESGQLMISKSKHLPTILLSLYYNINGPSWYYPIFSQNASGEGDKETFIAGAHFYGLPFYQVKSTPSVDGYHQSDNGFRGVAMLQHDFVQDYQRYNQALKDIDSIYSKEASIKFDSNYTPLSFYEKYFNGEGIGEEDVMFVHSNLPKFDPLSLWKDQDLIVDGKHIRAYKQLSKFNGYDLEFENFKVLNESLCVQGIRFKYLDDSLKNHEDGWEGICKYIGDRLAYLEETHEVSSEQLVEL